MLGIDTDDDDIRSVIVNGWVMNELGQIPKNGDTFEYKGYRITVLETVGNRVGRIKVSKQNVVVSSKL